MLTAEIILSLSKQQITSFYNNGNYFKTMHCSFCILESLIAHTLTLMPNNYHDSFALLSYFLSFVKPIVNIEVVPASHLLLKCVINVNV